MKRSFSRCSDAESSLFRAQSLPASPFASFHNFQQSYHLQRSMTDAMEMLHFLPSLPSLSTELKQQNDDTEMISFLWPSLELGLHDVTHQDLTGSQPVTSAPSFNFPGFTPLTQPPLPAASQLAPFVSQTSESSQPVSQASEQKKAIPKVTKSYLNAWIESRYPHPYASDEEKAELSRSLGLPQSTIFNFLINARTRTWKPSILSLFDENRDLMERRASLEWAEKIKMAARRRDVALVIPCLQAFEDTQRVIEERQTKGEADCEKLMAEIQSLVRSRI